MSSQRAFFKIILTVVAIVLILHVSFSIISTSTAAAAEQTADTQETEIAILPQQIETLNQLIEELSGNEQFILVLRIEQECLGGAASLQSTILQIPVDKGFFDSCRIGEDITDSSQIRLLSSSLLAETKVYVEDKYTISR